MANIFNRFNGWVKSFSSDATTDNRTVFGETAQSDDIDDNLNALFKKGWEIVGLNDNPTKQDFNAQGYTLGLLIAYLYQSGVSEWNEHQPYRVGSQAVGSDGFIYRAKTGNEANPNLDNDPISDTTNWSNMVADSAKLGGQLPAHYSAATHNHDTVYSAVGHAHYNGWSLLYTGSLNEVVISLLDGVYMIECDNPNIGTRVIIPVGDSTAEGSANGKGLSSDYISANENGVRMSNASYNILSIRRLDIF